MIIIPKILYLFLCIILASAAKFVKDHPSVRLNGKQPVPNKTINVHLIPHSHDDVGWLKTVDQYYYGARNDIQVAGVQYILDTVVSELSNDPNKRFVYVEIGFFYRWWSNADAQTKDQFRKLVQNGQLEFINGGWCMHDEATPYYEDMVDQMTLGHQFLLKEFGVVPKVAWHIDPFGHSAANAALFNQMGFDSFFFARIDYQDKVKRMANAGLEMLWNNRQDSNQDHSIFTHVNYNHYESPDGFCFDILCRDQPIQDDPNLEGYNIQERAEAFVKYFKIMSKHYLHNTELMHTLGSDFQYQNAHMNFKNYDKLIKYINARPEFGLNIFYSTPSQYIQTINRLNVTFPSKTDDFFPYADVDSGYWTGYFVSRSNLKYMVRTAGRYLQSVRTMFGLLNYEQADAFVTDHESQILHAISSLEQAMAVSQHHDAVAGTEKQPVAWDYAYQLDLGLQKVKKVFDKYLEARNSRVLGEVIPTYESCSWNQSSFECAQTYNALSTGKPVLLNIYNPAHDRLEYIRTKVPQIPLDIYDVSNQKLDQSNYDIICSNQTDANDCDLFIVASLKAYSFEYYKLVPTKQNKGRLVTAEPLDLGKRYEINAKRYIQFSDNVQNLLYTECSDSGNNENLLLEDQIMSKCQTQNLNISFNYYKSYQPKVACDSIECKLKNKLIYQTPQEIGQLSGAYIFRPSNDTIKGPKPYITKKQYNDVKVYRGNSVTVFAFPSKKITHYLRIYHNDQTIMNKLIESETLVGSIDVSDLQGKEVVMNIQSQIQNGDQFFTDSNGLELQLRKVNFRPSWELNVTQPVSGNYYPINAMIGIADQKNSLFVLNDRTQGGSSYKSGNIEIMIQRRLTYDDDRGVAEPLNETNLWNDEGIITKMRHYIVLESHPQGKLFRQIQYYNDLFPIVENSASEHNLFLQNPQKVEEKKKQLFGQKTELVKVYVSYQGNDKYLIRFHNLDEMNSGYVKLLSKYREVSMTANQEKCQMMNTKLKWNGGHAPSCTIQKGDSIIILPLEIKTFEVYA